MGELTKHLRRCDTLGSLTVAQMSRLRGSCRLKKYPRDASVYLPYDKSETVLLLASGRAKLSHINVSGKQLTLSFLNPGELFGEMAVCNSGQRDEYCETMSDSAIIAIPACVLRQLMSENSDLSLEIVSLIGQRRRRIERRLKNVLFASTRQKLIHVLLDLASNDGAAGGSKSGPKLQPEDFDAASQLIVSLSHQELGNLIGTTREAVTVTLGHLRNEGLIRVNRRVIVLTNLERLRMPAPLTPGFE